MDVAHRLNRTERQVRLAAITDEIYSTIDRMAMRVGELLDEAKRTVTRAEYERWVCDELPFGLDTAKRLRAVFLAYRELPEATLRQLPRPWQALYALAAVDRPVLEAAVADGTVTPELTVTETRRIGRQLRGDSSRPSFSQVDVWVARLVQLDRSELSDESATALRRWMRGPKG